MGNGGLVFALIRDSHVTDASLVKMETIRYKLLIRMGGRNDILKPRTVFVTVGSTCFDALVQAVDASEVKEELFRKGYTDLLIQIGRGSYVPIKVFTSFFLKHRMPFVLSGFDIQVSNGKSSEMFVSVLGECESLQVDYFTYSSSIADNLRSASIVISHAGSGSIFETLRLGKPLIVVVNEDLMDNHQSELAEELAQRKHLLCTRPQDLYQTIVGMNLESLVPYPSADATPVAKLMSRFLGFPDD
ncbi:hypothetical protein RHSIM_Rhsim05G0010600 [Rhododendron simsii]|uniref:Glycosyl transferase family 28 C-terminal domain-containing protein n=1 Tax=Rhododendron simsii TaxID=118357 RepID=A0A834GUC4_RHOSS|nr:hypothetical protein RHSIM_Rhsim05G0010600 [Rhododendron simsii]